MFFRIAFFSLFLASYSLQANDVPVVHKDNPQDFLNLAKKLFDTDINKASEALDHALSLAVTKNNAQVQTNVLVLQSKIAFKKKDYFLTQQLLNRAEGLLPRINDQVLATQVLYLVADVKRKLKKTDESMNYIQKALVQAEQLNNDFLIYQSLIVKGAIHKDLKRFSAALNTFLTAEKYIKDAEPLDQAVVLRNIANMYTKIDNLPSAVIYFKKALTVIEGDELEEQTPQTLLDIAKTHRKQGEFSEALQAANKALTISKKYQNQNFVLKSLVILSRIYRKIGSFEDALTIGLEALSIYESKQDYDGIALSAKSIGLIYANLDQFDNASLYFEQILALPSNKILPIYRVAALREQGFLYFKQDKHTEALNLLKEAQQLYEQLGDKKGVASVDKYIGMIYQDLGKVTQALEVYNQAIDISRNGNDTWSEAILLSHKASLLAKIDPETAIRFANQSVEIATEIGAKNVIEKAYNALITSHRKLKNYKQALHFAVLKEAIINDIKNEAVNKRLAEIKFVQDVKAKMNDLESNKYHDKLLKLEFNEQKYLTSIESMTDKIESLERKNQIYLYIIIALVLLVFVSKLNSKSKK